MTQIALETVIGNAFAHALDKGISFLPFSVIEQYADDVRNSIAVQRKIVFYFGRDEMRKALRNCSSIFEEAEEHGMRGIRFIGSLSARELVEKYAGYLPLDLAVAFSRTKLNVTNYAYRQT